jgi:phosphopentomutase
MGYNTDNLLKYSNLLKDFLGDLQNLITAYLDYPKRLVVLANDHKNDPHYTKEDKE